MPHIRRPPSLIIPTTNPRRYDPQICGSKECPYVNLCLAQAAGFTDAQCNPPPPCTLDVKVCPTGEVYRRSPLLDCNFPPCPGQTCPLGELESAFVLLIIHPLIKLTYITQQVSFLMFSQSNHSHAHLLLLQTFYGVQMESMSVATLKTDADLILAQLHALWILR